MISTLFITSLLSFPVLALLIWSLLSYKKQRTVSWLLRLIGSAFLMVVILAHLFEAKHLFMFMGWGSPKTPGHYLDLASAILGVSFLTASFLFSNRQSL